MLSDEQLIDRLQTELAPLRPRADLVERLREQGQAGSRLFKPLDSRRGGRRRRLRVAIAVLAASGLTAVAAGFAFVEIGSHRSQPQSQPQSQPLRPTLAVRPARPNAGPVTCQGGICHQGPRLVRNPSGSSCGQHSTWVAVRKTPQITYGCASRRPEAAY